MGERASAWILPNSEKENKGGNDIQIQEITLPDVGEDECLVEPIYGCWEGNMSHAIDRKPVDVAQQRGEDFVVLGNAGVVRVLRTGANVSTVTEGQHALLFCNGVWDKWGYPIKIFGYDAPGSIGLLSKRTVLHEKQVIPIPDNSRYTLKQWAAFSLRYITAWSNWQQAYGCWRVQMTQEDCPSPYVWGWGGGVSWAELTLARFSGAKVTMISGNPKRLRAIRRAGMNAVDRRAFPDLDYDSARYRGDKEFKTRYLESERVFLRTIEEQTDGLGVSIFLDYVGSPVTRATIKALSRQGVVATAGWKEGMKIQHIRAIECIERHTHVHTHYARYTQGRAAVQFAENTGWMPDDTVDMDVYDFQEIPKLHEDYNSGHTHSYFPIFEINKP
ncbi:MAG: zinc-binding dehydrogenase [Myxococcales bacterium]|nr:zinc-binding dehydrogenase [Myxococcales bacterium]